MKLTVISTGSKGNAYIMTANSGEQLLIECGVLFKFIQKALNFDYSKVVGCIVTHSHLDHCKGAKDVCGAGIDIYTSSKTKDLFRFENHRVNTVESEKQFNLGNFKIIPFWVKHDVPCFGYLIYHPECGKVLFVTDTYMVEHKFSGLNNIIIEANYCEEILEDLQAKGLIHNVLHDRVIQSHLSLRNCKGVLKANDLSLVNNIVLIHLSERNSDAEKFQREVASVTGKIVTVATKDLVINFDITPF